MNDFYRLDTLFEWVLTIQRLLLAKVQIRWQLNVFHYTNREREWKSRMHNIWARLKRSKPKWLESPEVMLFEIKFESVFDLVGNGKVSFLCRHYMERDGKRVRMSVDFFCAFFSSYMWITYMTTRNIINFHICITTYIWIGLFGFCLSISFSFYDYYPMTIQKWYLSFIARIHYLSLSHPFSLSFYLCLSLSPTSPQSLARSMVLPILSASRALFDYIFPTWFLSLLFYSPSPTTSHPFPIYASISLTLMLYCFFAFYPLIILAICLIQVNYHFAVLCTFVIFEFLQYFCPFFSFPVYFHMKNVYKCMSFIFNIATCLPRLASFIHELRFP